MKESDIAALRCVRCAGPLEFESLRGLDEGFLRCACGAAYPVAEGVPVMWRSFAEYVRARPSLGGRLMLGARTRAMKEFVKESMRGPPAPEDRALAELRWAGIYRASGRTAFYREAARALRRTRGSVVEYGCSVGRISGGVRGREVFGIDRSFYAVREASKKGGSYAVADALEHPFGGRKFGAAACFNMLEAVDWRALLDIMAGQSDSLVISSPYDYPPGREGADPQKLRRRLRSMGFAAPGGETRVPWTLRLGGRARLAYEVDIVEAERRGWDWQDSNLRPLVPETRIIPS